MRALARREKRGIWLFKRFFIISIQRNMTKSHRVFKGFFYGMAMGWLAFLAVSCEHAGESPSGSSPSQVGGEIGKEAKSYVGLSLAEAKSLAKKQKRLFRIIEIDGESMMVTKDYRPNRVNAKVARGVVKSISFG